jgi:hypothetical protein
MMKLTTAALMGAGMLALTATTASAEIVCNADGDCWHVREHRVYEPGLKLRVYPDNWKWKEHEKFRWHEHAGHGYWRSGVWVDL